MNYEKDLLNQYKPGDVLYRIDSTGVADIIEFLGGESFRQVNNYGHKTYIPGYIFPLDDFQLATFSLLSDEDKSILL